MDSSAVPKVSVIIPLYNKAPYIKRALDSVFAQTVQDFEIVVVGGNSTDGGEKIVLGYSDPRVRFVKEAGKGVSAARNQGVEAARAELVAFLDADDEWLPEFLETIINLVSKYPDAGAYATSLYTVNRISLEKYTTICGDIGDGIDGVIDDFFKHCLTGNRVLCSSTAVIPHKILYEVGLFNQNATEFEDLDLWCRIAYYYDIVCSKSPQAIYHVDPSDCKSRMKKNGVPIQLPFEYFLNKRDKEELASHKLYNSIINYVNIMRFELAHRCLMYNEREKIHIILKDITGVNYLPRKMLYLSLSLIPHRLFHFTYNIIRNLYHIVKFK